MTTLVFTLLLCIHMLCIAISEKERGEGKREGRGEGEGKREREGERERERERERETDRQTEKECMWGGGRESERGKITKETR